MIGLFWGKRKIIVMAKVLQFSEITPGLAFTEFDFYKDYEDLKSASNLNGNLNCSKELEHYAS